VLALSEAEGKLQLSLRNFSDTKNVATSGTTVQSLVSLLSGKGSTPVRKSIRKKEIKDVVEPPKEYFSQVQVIEGHKVNDLKFKEGSH
jgi:Flp pilus assembly protein CpaB